jgi:hypothetical protein
MEVLENWWNMIDPDKHKTVNPMVFRNLLLSKRIITRESEFNRLIKQTIPGESVDEGLR